MEYVTDSPDSKRAIRTLSSFYGDLMSNMVSLGVRCCNMVVLDRNNIVVTSLHSTSLGTLWRHHRSDLVIKQMAWLFYSAPFQTHKEALGLDFCEWADEQAKARYEQFWPTAKYKHKDGSSRQFCMKEYLNRRRCNLLRNSHNNTTKIDLRVKKPKDYKGSAVKKPNSFFVYYDTNSAVESESKESKEKWVMVSRLCRYTISELKF